ncbi:unnamed protein product, partial [marine sediment metagenome]
MSTVNRATKGAVFGVLIGLGLLGIGLLGWLVGLLLGVEEDASLDGFGIIAPLLVLSSALAGGLVGLLWQRRESFLGAFCVGTCAAGVVAGGITFGFYLAAMPNMDFSAANLCVVALSAVA